MCRPATTSHQAAANAGRHTAADPVTDEGLCTEVKRLRTAMRVAWESLHDDNDAASAEIILRVALRKRPEPTISLTCFRAMLEAVMACVPIHQRENARAAVRETRIAFEPDGRNGSGRRHIAD